MFIRLAVFFFALFNVFFIGESYAQQKMQRPPPKCPKYLSDLFTRVEYAYSFIFWVAFVTTVSVGVWILFKKDKMKTEAVAIRGWLIVWFSSVGVLAAVFFLHVPQYCWSLSRLFE